DTSPKPCRAPGGWEFGKSAAPPPPPPPPPAPGWGGGQPRGGWGRPPAAAKPGVIPLRPLGVGEILDGAVSTMRAHWRTVLGISITVSVISEICGILVERFLMPEPPEVDPNATPSEALSQSVDSLQSSLLVMGPVLLITVIVTLFTTALLTVVISRSVLGHPVTLSDAWREARPRLPQLLGLTLLLPLVSAAIMTVGILPGLLLGDGPGIALAVLGGLAACGVILWLMIRFALASPALMLERQGVIPSLRRSAKLVQGAWWRTFGIVALTLLLTLLVSMIIAVPFSLIAFAVDGSGFSDLFAGTSPDFGWPFLIITGIGSVIASSITYPISAGVYVLLYVDQRIRREALDLELARAAGVPGYGSAPPGNASSRS
uniref:DUF7544 domain-containing protein n=2 Tax=Streptomyces lunaelactis TaxID=1535768 RepID=UPI0035A008B9